jgi:hypothetical protein
MAVDIKQLRIGAHVEVNGVRARVETFRNVRLSTCDAPHAVFTSIVDGEKRECGCFLDGDTVKPIPITSELLAELGCERTNQVNIWRKKCEKSIIIFRRLGDITRYSCEIWQEGCRAVANFRYLHEAEQFIYLTLGKELIEE